MGTIEQLTEELQIDENTFFHIIEKYYIERINQNSKFNNNIINIPCILFDILRQQSNKNNKYITCIFHPLFVEINDNVSIIRKMKKYKETTIWLFTNGSNKYRIPLTNTWFYRNSNAVVNTNKDYSRFIENQYKYYDRSQFDLTINITDLQLENYKLKQEMNVMKLEMSDIKKQLNNLMITVIKKKLD